MSETLSKRERARDRFRIQAGASRILFGEILPIVERITGHKLSIADLAGQQVMEMRLREKTPMQESYWVRLNLQDVPFKGDFCLTRRFREECRCDPDSWGSHDPGKPCDFPCHVDDRSELVAVYSETHYAPRYGDGSPVKHFIREGGEAEWREVAIKDLTDRELWGGITPNSLGGVPPDEETLQSVISKPMRRQRLGDSTIPLIRRKILEVYPAFAGDISFTLEDETPRGVFATRTVHVEMPEETISCTYTI